MIRTLSRRKYKNDSGLTLIELLITISIIGILSTVMVMGVSRVTSNANASSCQNAYQAYVLAYSAFQSDFAGSPPGELANLNQQGYVDSSLLSNPNFSLQFGVYQITRYEQSSSVLTIDFTATWLSASKAPPAFANSNALITGISELIDGRYQLLAIPSFVSGSTYRVTLGVVGATAIASTAVASSNPPVSFSILSESQGSTSTLERAFETYVFDSTGARVSNTGPGMLAPTACSYLK